MTLNEHLLTILGEECAEVAQRTSKALRFSLKEVQPGQPFNNAERLAHECGDLIAAIEMLHERGLMPLMSRERIQAKKQKVLAFLEYSWEQGTLTEEVSK